MACLEKAYPVFESRDLLNHHFAAVANVQLARLLDSQKKKSPSKYPGNNHFVLSYLNAIATAAFKQGDPEGAIESFEQVIEWGRDAKDEMATHQVKIARRLLGKVVDMRK